MHPGKVLIGLMLCVAASVYGQVRSIPENAERGTILHLQDMVVEIGGKRLHLAPGAQIRDASNRVVMPAALPAGAPVKFVLDGAGLVRQVWILTPEEAAQVLARSKGRAASLTLERDGRRWEALVAP